jgi:predicted transcriptional regulator
MNPWELYRSLSSRSRLAVISALKEGPLRYTEIMDETGLNTTDLSRQLHRLTDDDLVEKNPTDQYCITQYGRLVSSSTPIISFLTDNQEFFNTHDFSDIPMELVDNIGALRKGVFVNSVYESIELQQNIIPTIQERFWMMTDDLSPSWVQSTERLLDEGVLLRALLTPELTEKVIQEATPTLKAGMEFRAIASIPLVLGYSDKHALICFSKIDGTPDRNHYLFGYDYAFKHWVFHCFNQFWRLGALIEM